MSKKSLPPLPRHRYQDKQQDALAHPPSLGWFDLAKPARMNRKLKRGWRRKTGGHMLVELLRLVALALVAAVLLMGVK
ncbi:MAG: hypothetical protein PWP11_2028 [Thauera sp.]|nr:hypothetical protein [Thauera sp.]MDI3490751.1 hypothetical protein [Thauera sp.]